MRRWIVDLFIYILILLNHSNKISQYMDFNELLEWMQEEVTLRNNWDIITSSFIESVRKNCIFILWESSQLLYYKNSMKVYQDRCTTGKEWFWEEKDSLKSPRWLHIVWWIVWERWSIYQWIKEKKVTGKELHPSVKWQILPGIVSRVVILNWCEKNFNNNSYERSIYIHWSRQSWFWDSDEPSLRRSPWCFWLKWESIAELVDRHLSNISWELYVYIFEKF